MNLRPQFALLLTFLAMALPSAYGHPGHDIGAHGLAHVFSSPFHLSILAGSGAALFAAAYVVQRHRWQVALRLVGAAMVACAVLLWSLAR